MEKITYTERVLSLLCETTVLEGLTVGLLGEPGIGKSTFLARICEDSETMYYLSLRRVNDSKHFFRRITETLVGAINTPTERDTPYHALQDCTNAIGTKKEVLLVLDDVSTINLSLLLDWINELRVHARKKLGIVMVCGFPVKATFLEQKASDPAFARRFEKSITLWQDIPMPTHLDLEAFAIEIGMDVHLQMANIAESRTYRDMQRLHLKSNLTLKQSEDEKSNQDWQ